MTSEQIAAVVEEIRARVRARYEKQVEGLPEFCLPDLNSLSHARDAAEGKAAAIGTVNPRRGGPLNWAIQKTKQLISRALAWHVREQIEFNRAVIEYMDRTLAAFNEHNRHMLLLGGLEQQHRDAVRHLEQWRAGWDERWTKSEIQMLRSVAELQGAYQHRLALMEANFREQLQAQHADYLGALERAGLEIQKKLWDDLAQLRTEHERQIHTELRLIRQRAAAASPVSQPEAAGSPPPPAPPAAADFDYLRFAERFRGDAAYVAASLQFYVPYFRGRSSLLDLGCGRGEFLELMKQNGVAARGVDSDHESVSLCRQKGLAVEQSDLFAHLAAQPEQTLDGIFAAHVVEHLPAARLPELLSLAARALERGGLLAIETPNPDCLAIFATNFYIDPTHLQPIPAAQLHFYLQENGFGAIEVHQRALAAEVFHEVAALAAVEGLKPFQEKFFGGLDYAIIGKKL